MTAIIASHNLKSWWIFMIMLAFFIEVILLSKDLYDMNQVF